MKTLIIGAGPAGLATAGRMRKLGLDFEMIEQRDKIAWSWTNHYDRLLLHTVKQLSHLPHLEFPEDYPLYVPRLKLVEYFNNYAEHFNIVPHLNTMATSIKKVGNQWQVDTNTNQSFKVNHVVVATGVNRVPHSPTWKGQDDFKGNILHSRHYKNVKPFKGQRVLVIGMGNTGAELALDLAENGIESYISVRSPVAILPRDINGRPVQLTAKRLAKLPFGLGDWLGTQVRKIVVGDLSKYGLPISKVHPAVQLRETGKTPVIDLGTVKYIKAGKIKVIGGIAHFSETGVVCKNGDQHDFDSIILATGYRAKIDEFVENTDNILDKYACPKQPIGEGEHEGMYFVGFDNYKLGGILGTIFTDSETVAKAIQKKELVGA